MQGKTTAAADSAFRSRAEPNSALFRELVAHFRRHRTRLRKEWARRIHGTGLLTVMGKQEIFSEVTSVYDKYVEVLETGSVTGLQAYARALSERIIPRGVETHEVLGVVLLLRDVLARSLFQKYHRDFQLLNRVLDAYEPAANRIANTVGVSFVEQRERVLRLRQLNEALEQRNLELAAVNRQLGKSEEHYRNLFHEARLIQENLRTVSNQILRVEEEERKRISRELHDEVGQALNAVNMNLAAIQRDSGVEDGARLRKRVSDTRRLLLRAMDTVHSFARELRPSTLDDLGLLPALRSYLKEYTERTGLRVQFRGSIKEQCLSAQQRSVLFRVAQESLTNVVKHSRAGRVDVTLRPVKNGVQLRIRDDGKGFAVDQQRSLKAKKRLGLLGMQERVHLVNGRFGVKSAPGLGTTLTVELPIMNGTRDALRHSQSAA